MGEAGAERAPTAAERPATPVAATHTRRANGVRACVEDAMPGGTGTTRCGVRLPGDSGEGCVKEGERVGNRVMGVQRGVGMAPVGQDEG